MSRSKRQARYIDRARRSGRRRLLLQRILESAGSVLDLALDLVGLAVGLQLGIAGRLADRLLDRALEIFCCSCDPILVHDGVLLGLMARRSSRRPYQPVPRPRQHRKLLRSGGPARSRDAADAFAPSDFRSSRAPVPAPICSNAAGRSPGRCRRTDMFYIIGVVVILIAGFFGLR